MIHKMLIYKEDRLSSVALFKSCTKDGKIVTEIHINIFYKIRSKFFVAECIVYCTTASTPLICYL